MMSCNSEHMDSNVHFSMGSVVQPRVIAIPCLNPEKASCIPGLIPKLICTHEDGLNFLSVEDRINALDIEATQAPILGPAESQSVIALSAKSALEPKMAKRSFEALCNAVNTELRTIGQSEVQSSMVNTSKVAVPTPVIIARTMVPVVGGVPWNIVSNMPSAENGSSNAGSGVAQLVPLLNAPNFALGNALQLTPCFMPTEVGKPFIDSKLLTTQSVNVPVTPQLILSPAISVDASSAQLSSITMQKKQETVPAVAMQLKPDQVGVEKPDGKTSVSNLRHACTFCSRICAKPSVLEKHLRTHTGERPFPCQSCGLHFKTKSNLYKHCKSRAHQHSLGGPRSETVDSSQEAKLSSVSSSAILSLVGGKLTKESTQHHHRSVEAASDDQHQLSSVTEPLSSCDVSSNVSPARTHIVVTDENSVVHSSDSQTAAASPQRVEKSSQIPLPFVEMQKSAVVAHQSNRTWLEIDKVHIQSNIKECSPPKADLKVMMTEALDDRITRLISQNDTIINTPMAEPPRPKRIIRQSSDFSGQGSAKSLAKPLLRTRSLNPPDKVSADEMDGKLARLSVLRVEDFESKNLPAKGEKAATAPISTDKTLGSRYLTVPGSYPQDSAGSLKQLPLPDNESEFLPDASSSSVRIVLQLCDSVSVSGGSSVPSNPAVTSSSISSTVNSTSLRSSAPDDVPSQVGPPVLPASSSPLPALCIINPYQPASNSGSLSLQYVPQTHISNAVPLQYLVVSSSSAVSAMQTSSKIGTVSSPALVSSSAVVDINCQQPPRRGRPKGSKNRPKLAASSSDPQSRTSLTETTLPVSATDTPSTAGPLWKLKLKNQLLMRRSASNERVFATEQSQENSPNSAAVMSSRLEVDLTVPNKVPASKPIDNLANLKVWSSTPPCPVSVSTEVTETSTVTISRSLSCDASVPLKKRRKTLTELGRGTAFGTRVEDAAVNCESAANELSGCEKADSKDLSGDTLDPSKQSLDQDHFGSRPVSGNVEPLTSSADTTTRSCLPSADVSEPCSGVVEKNLSYPSISIGSNSRSLGVTLHRIVSPVVESGNAAAAQSFASDGVVLGQQVLQLIPSVSTQKSSTCDSAYESTGSSILKSLTGDSGLGSLEGEGDPDVFISEPCSSSASALLTFLGCDRSNSAQSPSKKPIYSTVVNIQSTPTSEVQSYRTWIKSTPNLDRGENDDVEQAAKAPTETSTKRRTDDLSHAAATFGKKKYLEIVSRANYSNCRNEEYKEGTEVAAMSVDGSDNAEKDIKVMEVDTVPPVETAVSVSSIAANKAVIKPKPPLVKMASVYNVGSSVKLSTCDMPSKRTWVCPGGYRSMESYVYVRGRGRGRYVCAICGVRCKKPSILRKHLHSHTDSRPHHCTVCDVGFKTKGNLSKHINSKVHHLRISEQSGQLNSSADSASISERLTGQSDTDSVSQAVVYSPHVSIVQQQQQSIEVESDSRYEFRNNSGCNATIENGPGSSPNPSAQQSSSSQSKEDVDANDSNGLDKHSTADTDAATSLLSMSVCQKSPLGVLEAPAVSPNECVLMTAKVPADPALEGRKKSAEDIFVLTRRGDKLPGSGILSAGFVVRGTTSLLKSTVPGPVAVLAESGTIDGTFDDPAGPTPYPISNDCATIAAASAEPGYDVSHADLELLVAQNLQVPSVTAEQRPSSSERAGRYLNKVSHRLSRLDAVDLSSNSVIDTAVGENPVKGSAKATPEAALTVSSAAANVEEININSSLLALNGVAGARVKPSTTKRCEIYPVPGRVSAEGVRIGTSHACPVCSKPFNNAAQLAIHSNIHYMERPARCAHCRATFASQALLTRHRLAEHPDASSMNGKDNPRPYRCEECGVAFRIQGHLAKHRRSKMHAARMEGLTSEASTLDDENSESNSGEQIQHEIDESLESVDSSVAEQTAALEVQLASTVESCDSPAENGSSVQAIVDATEQLSTTEPSVDPKSDKTKELAPPRSVHTCALCKQTFDVICDFAMHMMSHAEPRHFICEECDAGFTSAQRLAEHKKVHNMDRVKAVVML